MNSEVSIGDLLAVMNDRGQGGFGGGSWLWVIFLFFIFAIFFSGGNIFNRGSDTVSKADLCEAMNFNQLENATRGTAGVMNSGFNDIVAALSDNRFASQQCCCETNRNIDAVRAESYRNTCDITTAIHAEGEATRALINANTMQELRDKLEARDRELMTANFQLGQQAQSALLINELRPTPTPAYITCSPYASYNCGYGAYGSGCNCGC